MGGDLLSKMAWAKAVLALLVLVASCAGQSELVPLIPYLGQVHILFLFFELILSDRFFVRRR